MDIEKLHQLTPLGRSIAPFGRSDADSKMREGTGTSKEIELVSSDLPRQRKKNPSKSFGGKCGSINRVLYCAIDVIVTLLEHPAALQTSMSFGSGRQSLPKPALQIRPSPRLGSNTEASSH